MTPRTVAQVVTWLFAAAGRSADEATLSVWAKSLEVELDDDAMDSAAEYASELREGNAPAISGYLGVLHRRARRRQLSQRPALPAPRPDPAVAREQLAAIRESLRKRSA